MDKQDEYDLLFKQFEYDLLLLKKTEPAYRFESGRRFSAEWFGRIIMAKLLKRSDIEEQCRRAQQMINAMAGLRCSA